MCIVKWETNYYHAGSIDTGIGITIIDIHITSLPSPAGFTSTAEASWNILQIKEEHNIIETIVTNMQLYSAAAMDTRTWIMIALIDVFITVRTYPAMSTCTSIACNEILCADINDMIKQDAAY